MRRSAVLAGLLSTFTAAAPTLAGAQVYKCTQPDGKVTLGDKECATGARRQGLNWVDVEKDKRARDEADRQRIESAERRKRLAQEQAEREADRLVAERHAESDRRKAAAGAGIALKPFETTEAKVDRMTSYATMLGRAAGCGHDTRSEARRVGLWLDAAFTTEQRRVQLPIFTAGVERQASAQKRGATPDSCARVREAFARFPWP